MNSPDPLKSHFVEMLQYSHWANLLWLDYLATRVAAADPVLFQMGTEKDQIGGVLQHIVSAELIWFERITGNKLDRQGKFIDLFNQMHNGWLDVLETRDLEENIQYRRLNGEHHENILRVLLAHVVNHGTFHRGQLRQMVEQAGLTDWPETDILYFDPQFDL